VSHRSGRRLDERVADGGIADRGIVRDPLFGNVSRFGQQARRVVEGFAAGSHL
jgi:hypothetical protein